MTQTLTLLTRLRTLTDEQREAVLAYFVGYAPNVMAEAIDIAIQAYDESESD